ncbi:DUF1499 domain-containing protein [Nioella aestuarii]|uniref:DUF1499 domain-containing protein n=1 Tax=Nioella aestuarii TaxID=1662864 RepID=UPI003D7FD931
MRFVFLALLLSLAALLLYIRLAPMQAGRWHVDPSTAERPSTPNAFIMRDEGGDRPAVVLLASPQTVGAALETMLASAPRVTRLAGTAEDGFVTYVQRSRIMGFPDAISIRLSPTGEGTRIEIFSRSRFGYSDGGVNEARVTRWIARLEAALTP